MRFFAPRARSTLVDADPYALWAPHYPPEAHNALMRAEQVAMLRLLPDVSARTVLDAGCGTGRYASVLLARGARRVLAVDRSAAMLGAIRHGSPVRADLQHLPIATAAVDVVVSGLVMMDVPALPPVLRECARVLTNTGVFLCSTLHPRGRALGWTRAFDTPQGSGTLPSCWHTIDDFRNACAAAGLSIDAVIETAADLDASVPADATDGPVALVVRARRHD